MKETEEEHVDVAVRIFFLRIVIITYERKEKKSNIEVKANIFFYIGEEYDSFELANINQ